MSIEIAVDGERFAPGDRVRGRVTVRHGGLQVIQVGLLFREESPAGEATARQVLAEGFEDARDLAPGTTLDFEIELPADAPPDVRTSHGGLFWEVVAVSDRAGSPQPAGKRIVVERR